MLSTIAGLGATGILLLFLEMFLPGLIAGIVGSAFLIIAVGMSYSHYGATGGNIALIIALAATSALWWWWANHFQNTRFGRSMTLHTSHTGSTATPGLAALIGQTGTTLTPLRPGGTVSIGGKKVDALSDGEFIETGTTIRVTSAQSSSITVHRTH